MLDVEVVVLDVGVDLAGQAELALESGELLGAEQLRVLLGDPVALGDELLDRVSMLWPVCTRTM